MNPPQITLKKKKEVHILLGMEVLTSTQFNFKGKHFKSQYFKILFHFSCDSYF